MSKQIFFIKKIIRDQKVGVTFIITDGKPSQQDGQLTSNQMRVKEILGIDLSLFFTYFIYSRR